MIKLTSLTRRSYRKKVIHGMIQGTLQNCKINTQRISGFTPWSFFAPVFLNLVFTIFLLLVTNSIHAKATDRSILIIYQKSQGFSQQLIDQLQLNLPKKGYQINKMLLDPQQLDILAIKKHSLLIAVGTQTTKTLLETNITTPILSALIPRHISISLQSRFPHKKNWSRILIDQPLDRQFHLITALLGTNKKSGILLGPYTKDLTSTLQKSAIETSQRITIEEIKNTDELTSSLKALSNKSNVLLTLPDPIIYNKSTIRGILLLAYRNKLPIIGFSQAYVKAGAIAAVYSKPEQISKQIGNISNLFFINKNFSQKEYYPEEFSVALNKKIARSLGIKLATNESITQQIKKAEKRL